MKSSKASSRVMRLMLGLCLLGQLFPAIADVTISASTIGKAKITSPNDPNTNTAKVGMTIFTLSADMPPYQKMDEEYQKPTVFAHQLVFSQRTLTYDWPANNTEYKPDKVYALGYKYDFVKPVNQEWMLVNFASLGAFTDFKKSVTDKDLLFEIGAMGVRQLNNGWDVGIGLAYTRAFGDNQLMPAPYFRYKHKESFAVDVQIPKHANVSYIPQENMQFTLGLQRTFDAFRLNPDPNLQVSHVAVFSDVKLGLEGAFMLHKDIALKLGVARTLNRNLEIKVDGSSDILQRNLENAMVYTVGIQVLL